MLDIFFTDIPFLQICRLFPEEPDNSNLAGHFQKKRTVPLAIERISIEVNCLD